MAIFPQICVCLILWQTSHKWLQGTCVPVNHYCLITSMWLFSHSPPSGSTWNRSASRWASSSLDSSRQTSPGWISLKPTWGGCGAANRRRSRTPTAPRTLMSVSGRRRVRLRPLVQKRSLTPLVFVFPTRPESSGLLHGHPVQFWHL